VAAAIVPSRKGAAGTGRTERTGPAPRDAPRLAFPRFLACHAVASAGDALVAIALSGTLFFSVSAAEARPKVALYLLLTMTPFAVLSPVVGPLVDRRRGARRLALVLTGAGRAAIAWLVAPHVRSLVIYPAAFGILVLSKAHGVARSALVPSLLGPGRSLVAANARLARVAVVAGAAAALPGVALLELASAGAVLRFAALCFAGAAVLALGLPRPEAGPGEERAAGQALASPAVRRAALASAASRALVGFLLFLLAFGLRRQGVSSAGFGLVLACAGLGSFLGAVVVPRLRQSGNEEWVIASALFLGAGASLIARSSFGTDLAAVLAAAVGVVASATRLGFEALVQREAPDAVRGRAFARFETLFQLAWVAGAALPTLAPIGIRGGLVAASVGYGLAAVAFLLGLGREGRARAAGSPAEEER
jgi:hypothetical protein